jgi:NitT/TauT family transport system substrate-binding protein
MERNMRGSFITRFLSIFSLVSFLYLVPGSSEGKELRAIYSAISGSQAVFFVTQDAGIFKKHGLEVSLVFVQGGPNTVLSLFAGEVPVAIVAGPSVIQLNMRGADLVFIAGLLNKSDYAIVAAPEIQSPADLRGKKFSISRVGDSSDFLARQALLKIGLQPDKEVAILQFGDQPSRFAAVQKGAVQATVVGPPNILIARKLGLRVLADPETLSIPVQGVAVAATKRGVASQNADIRRFMRALVEGIWFYKNRPTQSKKSIAQYLKLKDQEEIDDIYGYYRTLLPEIPYPTVEGINNLIDMMGGRSKSPLTAKDQMDNRFVAELEESGFIRNLYKQR